MKKITKRIMALMLSLVMVFGCVPSFVNEASADMPAKAQVSAILEMAENTFPRSLTSTDIPDGAWESTTGWYAYVNSNFNTLYFSTNGQSGVQLALTKEFTLDGSDYKFTGTSSNYADDTIFHMEDGKLVSIENQHYATFKPAPKQITNVDLVSMGFLTTTSPTYAPASSDTDKYTVDNTDTWKDAQEAGATTFTKGETYHKTLKLTPKAGFEFNNSNKPSISVDGIGLNVTPTVEADGTLTFTISKISEGNVVYISYGQDYDTYAKANAMVSAANGHIEDRIISNLAVDTSSYFEIEPLPSYP